VEEKSTSVNVGDNCYDGYGNRVQRQAVDQIITN